MKRQLLKNLGLNPSLLTALSQPGVDFQYNTDLKGIDSSELAMICGITTEEAVSILKTINTTRDILVSSQQQQQQSSSSSSLLSGSDGYEAFLKIKDNTRIITFCEGKHIVL